MSSVRFSHYCLDDGDEYFGDVIAEYRAVRLVIADNNTGGASSATPSSDVNSPGGSGFPSSSAASATNLASPSGASSSSVASSSAAAAPQSPLLQLASRRFVEIKNNSAGHNTPSRNSSSNSDAPSPVLSVEAFATGIRGRLRFAGKGVFFDADDSAVPIIGFRAASVLSSWETMRRQQLLGKDEGSWWNTPAIGLGGGGSGGSGGAPGGLTAWLGGKDVVDKIAGGTASTATERAAKTLVFPLTGSVFGQRRYGLPHPHIVDNVAFAASSASSSSSGGAGGSTTTTTTTIYLHTFVLPYVSSSQEYLSRLNMLLLSGVQKQQSSLNSPLHHTSSSSSSASPAVNKKLLMIQVARESTRKFKLSYLEDPDAEDILRETCCHRIQPLVRERGRALITSTHIYFQPTFPIAQQQQQQQQGGSADSSDAASILKVPLASVVQVERRWFAFAETALEIFYDDHHEVEEDGQGETKPQPQQTQQHQQRSIFLHFENLEQRELFGSSLRKHRIVRPILRAASVDHVQELWHDGRVSNLDYLLFLNSFAGRTRQDLSQYPILPWVLSCFSASSLPASSTSSTPLDLSDRSNFRDLSKPVGALNPARLQMLRERAEELKELGEPSFLYATHYSNPAYVVYFLLRSMPQLMLVLQSGRWDKPARLFESVPEVWSNVLQSPADVKELIPEFFEGSGDFLDLRQALMRVSSSNSNQENQQNNNQQVNDELLESLFDFGKKDDNTSVRFAVELPAWAKGSAETFIRVNRAALESRIVSEALHQWIDLIFGFKQRGEEAWKADNVFHPSCYEHDDDADHNRQQHQHESEAELEAKAAAKMAHQQMFGMVPRQIFIEPHPQRRCCKQEEALPTPLSLREALLEISNATKDLASPMHSPAGTVTARQISDSFGAAATASSQSSSLTNSFAANRSSGAGVPSAVRSAAAVELPQPLQQQPEEEEDDESQQAALAAALAEVQSSAAASGVTSGSAAVPQVEAFAGFDSPLRDDVAEKNAQKQQHQGDDDEKNNNQQQAPRGSADGMVQALSRGVGTLPAKNKQHNVSHVAVSSTGSIAVLSRDGGEVSVLQVGARGIGGDNDNDDDGNNNNTLSVTLPERCVSMLSWNDGSSINSSPRSASSSSWILLVSHTGTVLVLSAEKCRVYSRMPDTGNDSVITACGLCACGDASQQLFSGHDDGTLSLWRVSPPSSSSESSSSSSTISTPPVLTKLSSSEEQRFESGRPQFIMSRSSGGASLLLLASDEGETLYSTAAAASPNLREFSGFPNDVDMRSVALVWPVDLQRALRNNSALAEELVGGQNDDDEQIKKCASSLAAVGVLLHDGTLFTLTTEQQNDSGDLFEVSCTMSVGSGGGAAASGSSFSSPGAASTTKIVSSCLLQAPPGRLSTTSSSKPTCFVLAALAIGVVVLDADSGRVVTVLETATPVTHVAASWPFVAAVDAAAGTVQVWEMLMF